MCSCKSLIRVAVCQILLVVLSIPTLAQYQPRPTTRTQASASITITDPSSATTWEKGEQYTLKWNSSGIRGSVKIKLENASGKSITVATSTRNTGSYTWTVSPGTTEGDYRLVVTSLDGKTRGESAGTITVQTRALSALQTQSQTPLVQQQPTVDVNTPAIEVQGGTMPQAQTNIGNLSQTGSDQMTGFVSPDFEITGIQYQTGRLHVSLRNNGTPYTGSVAIRLQASEPADGFVPYSFDDVIDMNVAVGPGQVVDLQPGRFTWPSPLIDHHWLIFSLEVDPTNLVVEGNESNNRYQESICRPCNMEITGLSHQSFTSHDDITDFRVFGHFGSIKGTKRLRFELGDQTIDMPVGQWTDASLTPNYNVGSLGHGTYDITVFCRHPAIGGADASNTVTLRVNRASSNVREPLDARKTIDALGDEFTEGLDFASKIESLSIRTLVGYRVQARCHIDAGQSGIRDIVLVTHEIWRDGYRVAMWEDPAFEWNLAEEYLSHTFENLSAGSYEYRARILCRNGAEDAKSISFEL